MEKSVCDDVFLIKVADRLVNWDEIFVYFGISLDQAEDIKRNWKTHRGQTNTMLLLWKKFNEQNATINNLKMIFLEVGNKEIVDYIDEITAVTNIPETRPCFSTQNQLCQLKKTKLIGNINIRT